MPVGMLQIVNANRLEPHRTGATQFALIAYRRAATCAFPAGVIDFCERLSVACEDKLRMAASAIFHHAPGGAVQHDESIQAVFYKEAGNHEERYAEFGYLYFPFPAQI